MALPTYHFSQLCGVRDPAAHNVAWGSSPGTQDRDTVDSQGEWEERKACIGLSTSLFILSANQLVARQDMSDWSDLSDSTPERLQ